MKSMTLIFAGTVMAAAAFGSVAVSAHTSGQDGNGMMGSHMAGGHMEGMARMMTMMSAMSDEEHTAMHEACLKMMQSDGEPQGEHGAMSGHHGGSSAE